MPGRHGTSLKQGYRYGYQGQEKDDDLKGEGNSMNYEFRMHDTRVGRFLSLDPLSIQYPYSSPYAFAENRVIDGVELEGKEWYRPNISNTFGTIPLQLSLWTEYKVKKAQHKAERLIELRDKINEKFLKVKYETSGDIKH